MPTNVTEYTDKLHHRWDEMAQLWGLDNRDPVVGMFDAHNNWPDYEYLFKDVADLSSCTVLDFACGPGRNLVKYASRVQKIDGVDIAQKNLDNAKLWIAHNGLNTDLFDLYKCNGSDISEVPSDKYDLVISTIAMQHIASHQVRYNYLKDFMRVLKPGGMISIQMAFGMTTRDYFTSDDDPMSDADIQSASQVEQDLTSIGYTDFKYYLRPPGPGNNVPNWIYFNAKKPM